ncbi:hypothetical protein F4X86_02350 [Candidatus Saccharibacteria bacterium]|nr:hypothetical protein [Candidatus Saccharibacteria bacterium]
MKSLNLKAFGNRLAMAAVCLALCYLAFTLAISSAGAAGVVAVEADSVNGHENLPPGVPETEGEEAPAPEAGVVSAAEDEGPVIHLPAVIFIAAAAITGAAFLFFVRKFVARRP